MSVEKQNVTLALPKELLKQAKLLAVKQNKSLSGLLTEYLADIVSRHDKYEVAMKRQLTIMEKGFELGTYGKPTWTREELHDR